MRNTASDAESALQKSIRRRKLRRFFSNRTARQSRSKVGNVMMFLFIGIFGAFSLLPLVLMVSNSLKPLNELYMFPQKFLPVAPGWASYRTLFNLMSETWIPFTRYLFNTLTIAVTVVIGRVLICSIAAYPLAKLKFPGKTLINSLVMFSLMFTTTINDIANYLIVDGLGWLDTYFAVIIPLVGNSLGLFIVRNYLSAAVHDSLLEAARLDGCTEFGCYFRIVMPMIRPAWLTVAILTIQEVWGATHTLYLYSEELKTLPYALAQITSGSMLRQGAAQAGAVIMLLVPAIMFIVSQARIINAMGTSGIKE
ncbi:MAG: carbohydrate ABC transporter permease [Clostridia bacterium]|nr:carbohydrate ABC transporter permease [Clostridia bacterium]